MSIEQHLVVSNNVQVSAHPMGVTRQEIERYAHMLSDELWAELMEEDRDYHEALLRIEAIVLELQEPGVDIAEKVAEINNKLQPVVTYGARTARGLEVMSQPESYEHALAHILRITQALHNPGDEEWVATGVKVIQGLLKSVMRGRDAR